MTQKMIENLDAGRDEFDGLEPQQIRAPPDRLNHDDRTKKRRGRPPGSGRGRARNMQGANHNQITEDEKDNG